MKRLLILSVSALALSAAAFVGRDAWSAPEAATYAGDTVHSFVLFKIKHLGTSWVYGRFSDFTVSVDAAGDDLKSVAFTVKTGSVDTGTANRDTHLKGPDFFNAKQFPDVTFKSTAVKAAGADGWDVTGDLTLHGVTKPITVRVGKVGSGKGMKGEELLGLETTFVVKRSEYDMGNMVGPVGDDVTLTVAVEAAKK
jgi:polyisoprenoid-binding protein YceI